MNKSLTVHEVFQLNKHLCTLKSLKVRFKSSAKTTSRTCNANLKKINCRIYCLEIYKNLQVYENISHEKNVGMKHFFF